MELDQGRFKSQTTGFGGSGLRITSTSISPGLKGKRQV